MFALCFRLTYFLQDQNNLFSFQVQELLCQGFYPIFLFQVEQLYSYHENLKILVMKSFLNLRSFGFFPYTLRLTLPDFFVSFYLSLQPFLHSLVVLFFSNVTLLRPCGNRSIKTYIKTYIKVLFKVFLIINEFLIDFVIL